MANGALGRVLSPRSGHPYTLLFSNAYIFWNYIDGSRSIGKVRSAHCSVCRSASWRVFDCRGVWVVIGVDRYEHGWKVLGWYSGMANVSFGTLIFGAWLPGGIGALGRYFQSKRLGGASGRG